MKLLSGVYTIIHVRRTPVRRACTPYMYDSVNTALISMTVEKTLKVYGGFPAWCSRRDSAAG